MTPQTNGTATIEVLSMMEMHDKLARYRTALIALIELVKRDGGYQKMNDQHLVKQIERLLDEDVKK